ncbi:YoaK family protein [Tsukamurella soli]|uniref:YoaK family protein n=1 Tax=Tsukamurella soli TaxID=644556 RepID=A0ABP8JHJ2_9ACTN
MRSTSSSLPFALLVTASSGFLDAYTYVAKGRVFANAQTGNVILCALDVAHLHWALASTRAYPILAFVVGIAFAMHVKIGRLDTVFSHPIRWTLLIQAAILLAIGFIPPSWPYAASTIPIAFLASVQMELFRSIGDLNYMAIATTGNLMRLVEAGYRVLIDRETGARRAFRTYGAVVGMFAGGAVVGAVVTEWLGGRAVWVPAAALVLSLVLFVIDERGEPDPAP